MHKYEQLYIKKKMLYKVCIQVNIYNYFMWKNFVDEILPSLSN